MKSKALRNVSVVTICLAVVLALYAVRLGRQLGRSDEASAPEPELIKIVVAAENIEAGREIKLESLLLEGVSLEPEGSFHSFEEVAGRTAAVPLVPGEPIMEKHFRPDSAITQRLEPGERAMAVKVDGVIGMGGFIEPGDRVDVIVYVARDQKEVKATHARVLLEDVRVLAYGSKLNHRESASEEKPTEARTAVLAVPQDAASRLMLGASKGRLRLALRGPGDLPGERGVGEAVTLGALAGDFGKGLPKPAVAAPEPKPAAKPKKPRRVVHRGDPGQITRY